MCRGEQPDLNQLAEEFEGEISFVGVSNNDTVEDGMAYVDEFDVPYPMAHGPEIWEAYDVPYQPVTIVLGARQEVVERVDGPIDPGSFREVLASLTGGAP